MSKKLTLLLATFVTISCLAQNPKRIDGFNIDHADDATYINGNQNNYSYDIRNLEGYFTYLITQELKNDTLRDFFLKLYYTSTKNTDDINQLRSEFQLSIDTLRTSDSLLQAQMEGLKEKYNILSNDLNTIIEYSSVEKVDGEFVINFGKLKQNKDIIFDSDFHEGLAKVYNGYNSWGFMNAEGEMVIDFQYEDVGYFVNGIAPVKKNDKRFYIDRVNNPLSMPIYAGWVKIAIPFYNNIGLISRYDDHYMYNYKKTTSYTLKDEDYQLFLRVKNIDNNIKILDTISYVKYDGVEYKYLNLIWSNSQFHIFQTRGDSLLDGFGEYVLFNHFGKALIQGYHIDIPSEDKVVYQWSSNRYSVFDLKTEESIIEYQSYYHIGPFIKGLSIVTNRRFKSSIIDPKNAAKIPFRGQKIERITNDKFEVTYRKRKGNGRRKKIIFKVMKSGELKCVDGDCDNYFSEK